MHYRPFTYSEHKKVQEAVARYMPDYMIRKAVRSVHYWEDVIVFDCVELTGTTHCEIDLRDEVFNAANYSIVVLRCLRHILDRLENSDHADKVRADDAYDYEYQITKAFHEFDQNLGGKRYVALCRELIDRNMGVSLQPYAYPNLIVNIVGGYNKNVGKDTAGLMEAIADFVAEIDLDPDERRGLLSAICARATPSAEIAFAHECFARPGLRETMRSMIVDSLDPERFNAKEHAPALSVRDYLTHFPKEDLVRIASSLPRGNRGLLWDIASLAEEPMRLALVEAYFENPERDLNALANQSFFTSLPEEMRHKALRGKTFSPNARDSEIIRFYREATDEESKADAIRFCLADGREELAKALQGEVFDFRGFERPDVFALLQGVDLNDSRWVIPLTRFLNTLYQPSKELDSLLIRIENPEFAPFLRDVIQEKMVLNAATKLRILDRFPTLRGTMKEWRYHA